MTDQAREAFEKHIAEKYAEEDMTVNLSRDEQGNYIDDHVHIESVDWQAAYSAGLSAGWEQALEQAARECQMLHAIHSRNSGLEPDCAGLIRALGATQPEVK